MLVTMYDGWMEVGYDPVRSEAGEESRFNRSLELPPEACMKVRLPPMSNLAQGLVLTLMIGSDGQPIREAA